MAFAPDYVTLVLRENFRDAQARFLEPLLALHAAHLVMLVDCGLIDRTDARAIRDALQGLDVGAIKQAIFDGASEDLYFYVEQQLAGRCGRDTAGRLHLARSRNDIDMTVYRMRLREDVLAVVDALGALRATLAGVAARHVDTIFAAHTHTQPAQPTTLAHYLLAALEMFERDTARLWRAYETTNQNPLGSCAITGTGFPIDRERTSALLGFGRPTGNTYGSIAAVDYLLESTGATATALIGLGRLLQDLLFWCTAETGYLRLADEFVQPSSIMPQKRNPVALEHARALASRAVGELNVAAVVAHNTPFGDIVDIEDDLQPVVASGFRTATRALALVAAALATATVDVARMRASADRHGVTVTELADALVRDAGLSFTTAHAIAGEFARRVTPDDPADDAVVSEIARVHGVSVAWTPGTLARVLSPEAFVATRHTLGGPAPSVTRPALEAARRDIDESRQRLRTERERLAAADAARDAALAAI
jgi:argininosuccinate lyase